MLAQLMRLWGKPDAMKRDQTSDSSDDGMSPDERGSSLPRINLTRRPQPFSYKSESESDFTQGSLRGQLQKRTFIRRSGLPLFPEPPSGAHGDFESTLSLARVQKLVGIIFKGGTDLPTAVPRSSSRLPEVSKLYAQSRPTPLNKATFERRSSWDLPWLASTSFHSGDESGDVLHLIETDDEDWERPEALPDTPVIGHAVISKRAGLVFVSDLSYCKLQPSNAGKYSPKNLFSARKAKNKTVRNYPKTELCVDCRQFGIDFSNRLLAMQIFEGNTGAFERSPHPFNYYRLQESAKHCRFCKLLFKTLCRNSDFRLLQQKAEKYNDADFNQLRSYDSNGISERGTNKRYAKYKFNLETLLSDKTLFSGYHDRNFTTLLLDFSLSINTKSGKRDKTQVDEWMTIFGSQNVTFANMLHIPLDPRPDSDSKLQLLRDWFVKPLSVHRSLAARLPTRLLEINGHGVRLVRSSDLLKSTPTVMLPYVALSHRWGAKQHRTLTTKNILKYLSGLDIASFPQTFQDAIFVTRHLGMQYLWIDALCILQNSKDDWKIESLKMGDVYQGAEVVLAAHCAGDDSEGFLQASLAPSDAVKFCTVPTVFASIRSNYDADVTHSQLSRRGWVVQERFLASRTIHFAENHIYWDEPPKKLSEEGIVLHRSETTSTKEGMRVRSFGPSTAKQLRSLLSLEQISGETDSTTTQGTTLEWLDLVEMYSQCDLTMEGDKLVAIAGLAKVIQQKTGVPYCAGIWADNIAAGLLWLPQTERLSRPLKSRASSWSWAALDGPLQYPDDIHLPDFEPACKVIALNGHPVEGPGSNNAQWLDGQGSITLKAGLIDMADLIIKRSHWDPSTEFLGPGLQPENFDIQHSEKFPRMQLHEFVPVYPIRDVREGGRGIIGWVAPDIDEKSEWEGLGSDHLLTGDLFFLVVCTRERLVAGIFLKSTGKEKKFRRVGMGQLHDKILLLNARPGRTYQPTRPLLDEAGWNVSTVEIV